MLLLSRMADDSAPLGQPVLQPLGDRGLIVRLATSPSDAANRAAIGFARRLEREPPEGVTEIGPNLVSVLLKYDPERVRYEQLAGEVRLRLAGRAADAAPGARHAVAVAFGGRGPDLEAVAERLGLSPEAFVARHCAAPAGAGDRLRAGLRLLRVPCRGAGPAAARRGAPVGAARHGAVRGPADGGDGYRDPTGWHDRPDDVRQLRSRRVAADAAAEGDEIAFEALA